MKISTRYVAPIISPSFWIRSSNFMLKTIRSAIREFSVKRKSAGTMLRRRTCRSRLSNLLCLFLGPYRNLTTLTASTLFLHPNCQVLNHASTRIFGDQRIDFFANYSDATFDAFLRYAIHISQSGARGQYAVRSPCRTPSTRRTQ